ncbi:MAG: 7TM diverse intracellular signaling domain-containing protein [Bacteroidota bacterium]
MEPVDASGNDIISLDGRCIFWTDVTRSTTIDEFWNARDSLPFEAEPEGEVLRVSGAKGWVWAILYINQDSTVLQEGNFWRLQVNYPPIDQVDMYVLGQDSTWHKMSSGEHVNPEDRVMRTITPVFPIPNVPGTFPVVLHFRPSSGSIIAPLRLMKQTVLQSQNALQNMAFGTFYGALALFLVFNLVWFAFTRYRPSLYYAGFIAIYVINRLVYNGHMFLFFLSPQEWPPNLIAFLSNMWYGVPAVFFTIHFLDLKNLLPKWVLWLKILALAQLITPLVVFLPVTYGYWVYGIMMLPYLNAVLNIVVGVIALFKKHQLALVFLASWLIFYFGDAAFNLQAFQLIEYRPWQTVLNNFTTLFQIVLLSMALALRYALVQKSAKDAQAKALVLAKESERLLQAQNERLDVLVKERTKVLQTQNTQLRRHKELVQHINQNLERMVQERTEKAKEAQQHLLQFAFLSAHELRGPLARILGLNYLLKMKAVKPEENHMILFQVDKAAQEMDYVVKEITRTLEDSGYLTPESGLTVQEMRQRWRIQLPDPESSIPAEDQK